MNDTITPSGSTAFDGMPESYQGNDALTAEAKCLIEAARKAGDLDKLRELLSGKNCRTASREEPDTQLIGQFFEQGRRVVVVPHANDSAAGTALHEHVSEV